MISECVGVLLHGLGDRVPVQHGGVLPSHLANVVCRQAAQLLFDDGLRAGPRGIAMGVVRLEENVVHPDTVSERERRLVLHRAEPKVPLQ